MRRAAMAIVLAPFVAAACAIGSFPSGSTVRPASRAPARFEPERRRLRMAPADTMAGDGCISPLLDPATGTRIQLIRSAASYGDYTVPAGLYGTRPGELLRLECNTGNVVGIVADKAV